jgi:hypothetical protein
MTHERITDLAAGVAVSAKDLIEAHAEQLKTEIREEVQRATGAATTLAGSAGVIGVGIIFSLVGLVQLLINRYGVSAPVAWGSVGLILALIGVVAARLGLQQLHNVKMVPERTIESVKQSLEYVTTR